MVMLWNACDPMNNRVVRCPKEFEDFIPYEDWVEDEVPTWNWEFYTYRTKGKVEIKLKEH